MCPMTSRRWRRRWDYGKRACVYTLQTIAANKALGLEKMQKSTNAYIKAVSKRSEVEGKEKTLPIAYMGGTMVSHAEDFEPDSEYGQCLNGMFTSSLPRTMLKGTSVWSNTREDRSRSRNIYCKCYQ
jgi:hypothetical protein